MRYVTGEFYRDRELFADRLFCSEDTFAVADGMGVGTGGRVASEKAVELVEKYRPFSSLEDIETFFQRANVKIMKEIARLGDVEIAGTTLSLLSFVNGSYLIGHVGDSRIYLFRDGKLCMLTEDQVRHRSGKKHISALGIDWKPEVLLREGEAVQGDLFLLISDGALSVLNDSEIEGILGKDIEESAEELLRIYREKEPSEDMSFAIVEYR